jgi:hypothetical protein
MSVDVVVAVVIARSFCCCRVVVTSGVDVVCCGDHEECCCCCCCRGDRFLLQIRDYGVYDMTQLRFARKKGKKLQDNVYRRADGTLSRFFDCETLSALGRQCGLIPVSTGYECKCPCAGALLAV